MNWIYDFLLVEHYESMISRTHPGTGEGLWFVEGSRHWRRLMILKDHLNLE